MTIPDFLLFVSSLIYTVGVVLFLVGLNDYDEGFTLRPLIADFMILAISIFWPLVFLYVSFDKTLETLNKGRK